MTSEALGHQTVCVWGCFLLLPPKKASINTPGCGPGLVGQWWGGQKVPEGREGSLAWGAADILVPQHPSFSLLLPLARVSTSSCLVCSPLTLRVSGPLQSPHFRHRQSLISLDLVLRLGRSEPAQLCL